MSINHKVPRQDRRNVKRSPVKKHQQHSVGTKQPNDFVNPTAPKSAATQAGMFYARQANRTGR